MNPLHQKIIKLVPEVDSRELIEWCGYGRPTDWKNCGYCIITGELHAITLADVLRAIAITLKSQEVEGGGHANLDVNMSGLFTGNFFDWEYDQVFFWDLTTDLDNQTPELKAFLCKILNVEV